MNKYLVILDYTNGVVDIIEAPKLDSDDNFDANVEIYIDENYKGCTVEWMACSKLNIKL